MPRLSILRLVRSDYIAFSVVLYPVVLWAVCILLGGIDAWKAGWKVEPTSMILMLGIIALLITLICLPILGWRIVKINAILKDGVEVAGRIKSITHTRDRGIVAYTYKYQGKSYLTRATVHKTRQTLSLKPEGKTMLVISKKDPRMAFIRDLYTIPSEG